MAVPPWKLELQPASYNGVEFHVEADGRAGGRRKALHEFPKKNTPYLEDMGRRARRFTIAAYVIGPFYKDDRDALIEQLEADGDGQLVHPTYRDISNVGVEAYSVTERRERGGFAEFEIVFIEAGLGVNEQLSADTQGAVSSAADGAVPSSDSSGDLASSSDILSLTPTDI